MFTQEQLEQVLKEYPTLNDFGFGNWGDWTMRKPSAAKTFVENQVRLLQSLVDVNIAAKWISENRGLIKRSGRRGCVTSYGLKHVLERELSHYVTNGAFIAAAILVGLPHKMEVGDPNLYLNCRRTRRLRRSL